MIQRLTELRETRIVLRLVEELDTDTIGDRCKAGGQKLQDRDGVLYVGHVVK